LAGIRYGLQIFAIDVGWLAGDFGGHAQQRLGMSGLARLFVCDGGDCGKGHQQKNGGA
jgi:hypothetical protein